MKNATAKKCRACGWQPFPGCRGYLHRDGSCDGCHAEWFIEARAHDQEQADIDRERAYAQEAAQ